MNKKTKYANWILGLSLTLLIIKVLQNIKYYKYINNNYDIASNSLIIIVNIISGILLFMSFALHLILLVYIKKLRQTDKTKLLYNTIIGICIGSIIYSLIVLIFVNPYIFQTPSPEKHWFIKFEIILNNIIKYTYVILYAVVIFKEGKIGKNCNWMFVGSVLASTISLLRQLVTFIIKITGNEIILAGNHLELYYPVSAFLLRGVFITKIASSLWIVGAMCVAIIYKVNARKQIVNT